MKHSSVHLYKEYMYMTGDQRQTLSPFPSTSKTAQSTFSLSSHKHLFHSHVSFDRELLADIKIVFLAVLCLRTGMVWGGSINTHRGASVQNCWAV